MSTRVLGVISSVIWSMNIPALSRNVLQTHACAPLAPLRVMFLAPTLCLTDTPVWTAVSTVNSRMYYNNRINNELTNFDFMPLAHSKVKTCCSMSIDALIIEPEPAWLVFSAFREHTSPNDSETYQALNLHLNIETAGFVNPVFCGNTALMTRKPTRL